MRLSRIYDEFLYSYEKYNLTKESGEIIANLIMNTATWTKVGARFKIKKTFAVKAKNSSENSFWKIVYPIFVRLLES